MWPEGLQTLTFGRGFRRSLEGVALPSCLQSLTFGDFLIQNSTGAQLAQGIGFSCMLYYTLLHLLTVSELQSRTDREAMLKFLG